MCRSSLTPSTRQTISARSKVCRTHSMVKVVWLIQRQLLRLKASGTSRGLKARTLLWSRKRTTTSSASWGRAKGLCNQTAGLKSTRTDRACQREGKQWVWCQAWLQVQPLWARLQLALELMTRRWAHTRECVTHLVEVKAHTPCGQPQGEVAWMPTSQPAARLVCNTLT